MDKRAKLLTKTLAECIEHLEKGGELWQELSTTPEDGELVPIGRKINEIADAIWNARQAGIHPIDLGKQINQAISNTVLSGQVSLDSITFEAITNLTKKVVEQNIIRSRLPKVPDTVSWEHYFNENNIKFQRLRTLVASHLT